MPLTLCVCAGSISLPGNGSKALNYTFSMDSDDGSQLYINGLLVINDAGAAVSSGHTWSCRHETKVHVFEHEFTSGGARSRAASDN